MKICQLCAVDCTLKKLLLPLVDAQVKEGHEVISVCSDGPYISELLQEGYKVQLVPIARSLHPLKCIVVIYRLYRLFRRERFDLVHVHTPVAAFLGRISAWLARVPVVIYTAHGFYFHEGMSNLTRRIFITAEIFVRPLTDMLFTQSSEDARDAVALGIMSTNKAYVIGNGVNAEKYNPGLDHINPFPNLPDNNCLIVMVSRLVEEKGVVEFLKAAQKVASHFDNVSFALIGDRLASDYAVGVEVEVEKAKSCMGGRILLTGLREDIPEILSRANIFCLPSWREGMPRSIIEAMMMSVPVVATNIRGSREEVVDGETGILIEVGDVDSLVSAFSKLISDPRLATKMGSAGRKRALELYDEQRVLARQMNIIDEFIAVKPIKDVLPNKN